MSGFRSKRRTGDFFTCRRCGVDCGLWTVESSADSPCPRDEGYQSPGPMMTGGLLTAGLAFCRAISRPALGRGAIRVLSNRPQSTTAILEMLHSANGTTDSLDLTPPRSRPLRPIPNSFPDRRRRTTYHQAHRAVRDMFPLSSGDHHAFDQDLHRPGHPPDAQKRKAALTKTPPNEYDRAPLSWLCRRVNRCSALCFGAPLGFDIAPFRACDGTQGGYWWSVAGFVRSGLPQEGR